MSIERIVSLAIFCLLAVSAANSSQADTPKAGPNIILVICDDLAQKAIGVYGGEFLQTPHLDRLAEQGARFTHAFVTNSLCSPSRAAILTGKYSHLNGVADNWAKFDGSQPTLPKYLRQSGYETAMIGKWHLHTDPTGFDYWQVLPGQGAYIDPEFQSPDGIARREGYVTRVVTDEAIAWLNKRHQTSKPFYLQIGHKAPHSPWIYEEKYAHLFEDTDLPEPATLHEDLSHRSPSVMDIESTLDPEGIGKHEKAFYKRHRNNMPHGLSSAQVRSWIYQRYLQDYLRTVASLDEQMGRLLDYLDEKGLSENTLVIFTSDQGYFLGEHGFYSKHLMYEEPFSTPLLMRWPARIKPGTVIEDLVVNIDFAPTILDAAGAGIPDDMQGLSLSPLFQSPHEPLRDAVYYRYYHPGWGHTPHEGVRTDRYKLIRFMHHRKAPRKIYWELYDLQSDPYEMHNLYDTASPELKARLTRRLVELRRQYLVPDDNSDLLFDMGKKIPPLEATDP